MLPLAYLEPLTVRANIVQGPDGVFIDEHGSSRGISNEIDLERLLELRKLADVLVTDGATARLENYRVPATCDLAVFTRQGFTPAQGSSTKDYLELRMSPEGAIGELVRHGYHRILFECGPGSIAKLVRAGLLDELCLTNTSGSTPSLELLGISAASKVFEQRIGDTTFSVWRQIQAI